MASPNVDFGSLNGICLFFATQACMFLLLRNMMPATLVATPLLILLSVAPAWPVPLMLTAFLVLKIFVLPHVLHESDMKPGSSTGAGAPIRLDFRSNTESVWSKLHKVGSLAGWAVLHNFLSRAVRKYFD